MEIFLTLLFYFIRKADKNFKTNFGSPLNSPRRSLSVSLKMERKRRQLGRDKGKLYAFSILKSAAVAF